MDPQSSRSPGLAEDIAYQEATLPAVSRTFALAIPQLPGELRTVVGNAYLLCRIADTIEDAPALAVEEKKQLTRMFAGAVAKETSVEEFVASATARLDSTTPEPERQLVANAARVVRVTRSFPEAQQAALARCVRIMAEGVGTFQNDRFRYGLPDQEHVDAYCYYVAGVVGEMLTELFCSYSPAIARHRQKLRRLAVSFGQGLQMTNILKDLWEDKGRDVCWLPQSTFEEEGVDLKRLSAENRCEGFERGLVRLIAIARDHLKNALNYALVIPKSEWAIRKPCLWAIGMALLTLRKINRRRNFTSAAQVKISRRSVAYVIGVSRLIGRSNILLRTAFSLLCLGLP